VPIGYQNRPGSGECTTAKLRVLVFAFKRSSGYFVMAISDLCSQLSDYEDRYRQNPSWENEQNIRKIKKMIKAKREAQRRALNGEDE
jgi:hypothetical protein